MKDLKEKILSNFGLMFILFGVGYLFYIYNFGMTNTKLAISAGIIVFGFFLFIQLNRLINTIRLKNKKP